MWHRGLKSYCWPPILTEQINCNPSGDFKKRIERTKMLCQSTSFQLALWLQAQRITFFSCEWDTTEGIVTVFILLLHLFCSLWFVVLCGLTHYYKMKMYILNNGINFDKFMCIKIRHLCCWSLFVCFFEILKTCLGKLLLYTNYHYLSSRLFILIIPNCLRKRWVWLTQWDFDYIRSLFLSLRCNSLLKCLSISQS